MFPVNRNDGSIPIQFILTPVHYTNRGYVNSYMNAYHTENGIKNGGPYLVAPEMGSGVHGPVRYGMAGTPMYSNSFPTTGTIAPGIEPNTSSSASEIEPGAILIPNNNGCGQASFTGSNTPVLSDFGTNMSGSSDFGANVSGSSGFRANMPGTLNFANNTRKSSEFGTKIPESSEFGVKMPGSSEFGAKMPGSPTVVANKDGISELRPKLYESSPTFVGNTSGASGSKISGSSTFIGNTHGVPGAKISGSSLFPGNMPGASGAKMPPSLAMGTKTSGSSKLKSNRLGLSEFEIKGLQSSEFVANRQDTTRLVPGNRLGTVGAKKPISIVSTEKSKASKRLETNEKSFESLSQNLQAIMEKKPSIMNVPKEVHQLKLIPIQDKSPAIKSLESLKNDKAEVLSGNYDISIVANNLQPQLSQDNGSRNMTSPVIVPLGNSCPPNPACVSDVAVDFEVRKVADDVAVQMKTEIRDIISYVEHWKENRPSQMNSTQPQPEEKKEVDLKVRARNVIGEVLGLPNEYPNDLVKWHLPSKDIIKLTSEAIREFSMLRNGDRVLVCLSGGIDSLSLLHTMKQMQYVMSPEGIAFTFGAVTVDPKHSGYNPKPLIPYLKTLGVSYFYEEQDITVTALEKGPECITSLCSPRSTLKLGRINATARKNGYNVLAFGQNLDTLAESFLMSIFHNGQMRTMKAACTVKDGDLRVIRPFVNVREKDIRDFAASKKLPIIPNNCPECIDMSSEHDRVKQLLAQQEDLYPNVYSSLRSAMQPLMALHRTAPKCECDNYF